MLNIVIFSSVCCDLFYPDYYYVFPFHLQCVCECVFSSEFIYSVWIPWEKCARRETKFCLLGQRKLFRGCAFACVISFNIFLLFCIYGGNGIAYDSSNKRHVSLSRGVRNGARTCRVSNDNTNKTNKIDLRNSAVTGQKGNRNRVGGGRRTERRSIDM